MGRITLITSFENSELEKIAAHVKDFAICKVPYDNNGVRLSETDNLPFHLTIFATDKENQPALVNLAQNLQFDKIKIHINGVKIMAGRSDSAVLYLSVAENQNLKDLQKVFYAKIPEEKYNPKNFKFHITLNIDKDKTQVAKMYKNITKNFEPFDLEFKKIALYDYPGEKILEFSSKNPAESTQ